MTTQSPNLLKPGESLGPYRVDQLIGRGGISSDRKRFLFIAPPSAGRVIPFTVVRNWASALK